MSTTEGASILVVGGAGFVGSNLVHALLERDVRQVIVVDNLLSSERSNVPDDPRVVFIEASINDEDVLRGLPEGLSLVFHLATFHGNQNSIADPLADHEHNTLTTLRLFDRLSRLSALPKVVYASAGCTVAQKTFESAAATTEDDPVSLHLDSPYQISKIVGEFYANYYHARTGLPVVKARFQNVYGPREILGAGRWRGTASTVWRNVVPTFVYKSLRGEPLPVENGGVATRDFIFVEDLVRGLILCADRGGAGEVYNLASGVETSVGALAEAINRSTGNTAPISLTPARDWDRSGKRYGSTSKAREELGFVCEVELEDGLRRTVDWTRMNLELVEACIAKHADNMAEI